MSEMPKRRLNEFQENIKNPKAAEKRFQQRVAADGEKTLQKPQEPCECGCGEFPKGYKSRFVAGHDTRMRPRLLLDQSPCRCGCGGFPASNRSQYLPGHDSKHQSRLLKEMRERQAADEAEANIDKAEMEAGL